MLSKKMTVSLMSLITILAFAFIAASPAVANKVTLSLYDGNYLTDVATTLTDNGKDADQKGDVSTKDGLQALVNDGNSNTQNGVVIIEAKAEMNINTASFSVGTNDAPGDIRILRGGAISVPTGSVWVDGKTLRFAISPTNAAATSIIQLVPGSLQSLATGAGDTTGATITIEHINLDRGAPTVIDVSRSDGATHPIFEESVTFTIKLSEEPAEFTTKFLEVKQAAVSSLHAVGTETAAFSDGGTANHTGNEAPGALSADNPGKFYLYALTLAPKFENGDNIEIKVKKFKDLFGTESAESTTAFTVASTAVKGKVATAGTAVSIPNDLIIPAEGALIVAKNDGTGSNSEEKTSDSLIMWPGDPKQSPGTDRKPSQQTYNMIEADLVDLSTFLLNGGTIDLNAAGAVVISEIMWGTDGGSTNRQWIEIMNTTDKDIKTKDYKLMFYTASETVPPMTAAVAATATAAAKPAALPAGVADRVGTLYKGAYWSIAGRGQSGQTSDTRKLGDTDIEIVSTSSLVSMQRGMPDADGMYPDGTMAGSWTASAPPSQNFTADAKGLLIGTPGASPIISDAAMKAAADAAAAKAKADAAKAAAAADTSVPVPVVGSIYISEIMFAGGGTLPQWIEISNGSRTEEVNLSGWTLTVDNAAADADVSVGGSIKFTIPEGTKIDPSGQNDTPSTLLVVTETGRNNIPAASKQVINLWESAQTELILAGVTKRRYSLLSEMAFQITLAPPAPTATKVAATATAAEKAAAQAADAKAMMAHKAATDMAGNLGADGAAAWALPMNEEGARSSIIRSHIPVSVGPAEPKEDGTMMENWDLAADTAFANATHVRVASYYGAMNDVGTPGFRTGGALPVELSHFRPERKKETGEVVITWSTQSELNNAGFFIKRSQQKDGEFKVINATMIAGAGTTSEKQFYTYTDTTAQPNVVYYYQIEDVSLDGNRQTLTRGIRLKGHIGAAGKLTSTWGELKSSNE